MAIDQIKVTIMIVKLINELQNYLKRWPHKITILNCIDFDCNFASLEMERINRRRLHNLPKSACPLERMAVELTKYNVVEIQTIYF